tara:strand:+ start:1038 stop:1730 length:693 start_codon:yes stop_codon:yes gene_type:complete
MSSCISISVSKAINEVVINGFPDGFSITPHTSYSSYVLAEPSGSLEFSVIDSEIYSIESPTTNLEVGSIDIASDLSVTLGTLPLNTVNRDLDGFRYVFDNFTLLNPESFTAGDIVFFKEESSLNDYGTKIVKATTDNMNAAFSNLMIFLKYDEGKLFILHKGFFDYELDSEYVNDWSPGRTIYLNSQNNIDLTPTSISGSWVKSLGMCIPNKENKQRIWFDADTTYLKIR